MNNKLACLLILLVCIGTTLATTKAWKPQDIPNPKTHPSKCIDLAASKYATEGEADLNKMWVCNPDHILSSSTVDEINKELYELSLTRRSEECTRGTQVFIKY